MDIKDISKKIQRIQKSYGEAFGVKITHDWILLKLQEEFGEMTQQYMIMQGRHRKKPASSEDAKLKLAEEIADVVGLLLLLGEELNIDIEKAINDKWLPYLKD